MIACILSQATDYTSVQPIPRESNRRQTKALYFDANDGGFNVFDHFDNYSLTSADDTQDYQIFGVVGYMDFGKLRLLRKGFAQYLCVVSDRELAAEIYNFSIWKILSVSMILISRAKTMSLAEEEQEAQNVDAIIDAFSNQTCYYSLNLDLTVNMQQADVKNINPFQENDIFRSLNHKYCWNWHWIEPLIHDHCTHPFILPVVCGFIDTMFISSIPMLFKSVMDRSRVGTRFWKRGVNTNGDCVMDITTELIIIHPNYVAAYCIRRGSIPLLWRHIEVDPLYSPTISLSEAANNDSKVACFTNLNNLSAQFGNPVIALDISEKSATNLSCTFAEIMGEMNAERFLYRKLNPRFLKSKWSHKKFIDSELLNQIIQQGFFFVNIEEQRFVNHGKIIQNGIFRISSADCIDDTDVAQYLICKNALLEMLKSVGELGNSSKNLDWKDRYNFERLWMRNGDAFSKIYTGTMSLNRSLEYSWSPSIAKKLYIRISRAYLNCFTDQVRQDKLNIFMNQLTDGHGPQISPIANDIHNIRIQIRQAIIQREFSSKLNLSTYFFIQAWILPKKIEGIFQFLAAVFWLLIYIFYRLFGFKSNDLVRKTMSLQNVKSQ